MSFIGRALALILAFLLGFMSFFIAVAAGGYYVYTSLTYKDLVDKGIAPSVGSYVDSENAEVDLTTSTLQNLLTEYLALQSLGANAITVDSLLERYGINLPDNVKQYLPDAIRTMSFADLFTSEGLNNVLENTTLDYAFQYIPEGILSEPAKEQLAGKTLAQVVSMDFEGLLENIKLGYFIGTHYELDGDQYVVVYQDPSNPTIMELVSDLDLGRVLASLSGHDNLMEALVDCLGQVVLNQALGSFGIANQLISSVLADKKVADLLVFDSATGGYSLDVGSLINNRYVGELLGYTPVYASSDENAPLIGWTDQNGGAVTGIFRGLASAKIENFGTDSFDYYSLLNGFYFGDVLGYVPTFDSTGEVVEWKTTTGGDIDSLFSGFVSKKISSLFKDDTIYLTDFFDDLYVGTFLGYSYVTNPDDTRTWSETKEGVTSEVTGLYAFLANINLGDVLGGSFDFNTITNGLKVGTILGYYEESDVWYKDSTKAEEITGLYKAVAGIDIGKIISGESDFTSAFTGLLVGDLLGYTKDTDGTWYTDAEKTSPATGLYKAVANIDIGKILSGEADITSSFTGIFVGDLLGYTKDTDGTWYTDSAKTSPASGIYKALVDIDIGKIVSGEADITSSFNGIFVGDLLGYTKGADDVWYTDSAKTSPATGIYKAVAGIDLGKLLTDDTYKIEDAFDGLLVGDLLGYTKDTDGTWYTDSAKTSPATGVNKAIAGIDLGKLLTDSTYKIEDAFDGLLVGDLLGYTKDTDGTWYTDSAKTSPATGIYKAVAGIDLGKLLTDSTYKIEDAFDGLLVGDLLGYTKDTDGTWYTDSAKTSPATGIYKAVASIDLGKLLTDDTYKIEDSFQGLYVGDLLGYTKSGDIWKDSSDNVVTGINDVLAGVDIGKLIDGTLEVASIFDGVKMGKILGYYLDSGVWYSDAALSNKVTGINKTLAELDLGQLLAGDGSYELADAFQGTYVGDMLGYTKSAGAWVDSSSNPVKGLDKIIADVDLYNLIKGTLDVNSIFDGVVLGDVLGYTLDSGVWYKDSSLTNPITGIDKAIANIEIGKLLDSSSGYKITDAFNGTKLGDLLGYTLDAGTWYTDAAKTKPATGINKKLAGIDLGELMGDSFDIMSIFNGMYVGEALNYTQSAGVWYTDATLSTPVKGINKAVANINLGSLLNDSSYNISTAFSGTKLGDLLGYTLDSGIWYTNASKTALVTGINKKLANIDLGELMGDSFDIMSIFNGMYVGEALNYTQDSGVWYTDATLSTPVKGINKAVANINLGSLLNDSSYNISTAFSGTKLGDLLGYTLDAGTWYTDAAKTKPATGINKKLANIDLGELMGDSFDIMSIFDGMYVGEALNYTKDGGVWYTDATLSTPVTGINKAVANINLGSLLNDSSYDISTAFSGTKLGDLLGYTLVGSVWKDRTNADVTGINKKLANIDLGELMGDSFDIMSIFDGMYVGDALNYTKDSGIWYTNATLLTPVKGINKAVANINLGSLLNDPTYDISSAFSGTKLGDLLGYTLVGGVWKDRTNADVIGINKKLANIDLGELMGDTFDIMSIFDGMLVGDALGYVKDTGVWYTDSSKAVAVAGLNKTIADIDLGRLLKNDPTYDITTVFSSTKIGDVLGYTETASGWENGGVAVTGFMKVVASKTMNNLDSLMNELTIADVMDYKLIGGVWYESDGVTPVTGMMKTLAPKTVDSISSCLDEMTLADALGYVKIGGVWYESDGVTPVSAFLSSIADSKINELSTKLSTLKIGTIMGWTYEGGIWKDGEDPANGILTAFASFTIDDMTDSVKVSNAVQSLTLGQALGYTKIGSVWYEADGVTPVSNTGFLSIIKYGSAKNYDVPVGHIADAITDTFNETTMQEYIDNGIISIDSSKQTLLDYAHPGWRSQSINEFISSLI